MAHDTPTIIRCLIADVHFCASFHQENARKEQMNMIESKYRDFYPEVPT
jgi:hypothetical protein